MAVLDFIKCIAFWTHSPSLTSPGFPLPSSPGCIQNARALQGVVEVTAPLCRRTSLCPKIYLYCPPLPLQSWALEASHGLRPQTKVSSFSKEFVLQSHLLPSVSKGNENPRDSPFGFWTCFACLRVSFLPSTYNEKASSDICMRIGRYLLKKYPVAKGMSQGQS